MNLYLAGFATVVALLIVWWIPRRQTRNLCLETKDRLTLENEFRKTTAQIIGGAAILAGLYFTSQQLQASRRSLEIAQEAQTTERFTRAVDQIGNQQLQVRVGGIYALGEISKDPSYDRHWIVISVLASFLRDRASWHPGPPKIPLPEDIQAALSVIAARDSRGATYDATTHHVIDLTGTDLRRALLRAGNLQAVELTRAHLEGADLRGASLTGVLLTGAHLDEALLDNSDLSAADLRGAGLRGASLSGANLRKAHFEGVDLTSVTGLSSNQVSEMFRNGETVIPSDFSGQVKGNWGASDVYTRRSFIHKGLEALACITFNALPPQSTPKPLHIFIEESGVFGGNEPFCIGGILAMHPARHLSVIRSLRLGNHYRSRLLYRSTDKFRGDFATSVVDYFFRAPDLRFVGRVVNKHGIDQDSTRSTRETIYLHQYRKLISESAPKGYPVSLTLVNHSRGGVDTILRAYLQDEMPNLIRVQVARLRENDLLQMANLFAGSAAGGDRLTNEVRLAPVKQLERNLGVRTLLATTLSRHSKFRVRVV